MDLVMTADPAEVGADAERPAEIGIVDYGICNVGSVRNMLRRSGFLGTCSTDPSELERFDKLILPGIGFFKTGMQNLEDGGWVEPIRRFAASGKPILGICLGMQLLAKHSEEGDYAGLGLLDMTVKAFDRARLSPTQPVPHMGWSTVDAADHSLARSARAEPQRFYFVHSLHVVAEPGAVDPIFWCTYGYPFIAGCGRGNVMGVQFHPEKSHVFGAELLANFAGM